MAYFDIRCTHCEWKGEVRCSYDQLKEQQCDVCGSLTERLYTANSTGTVGANFTGTGWYKHNNY